MTSHLAARAVVTAIVLSLGPAQTAAQFQRSPGQQRTPPRDAAADEERRGTAVLRGRVVAADTGRGLRRARVSISAPELGSRRQRTTSTGLDGRYEFKDLPAARYTVSVTRGGYLPLQYGQRRPGELGRPIQLADGQVVDKVDFILPRMSVISGRVSDETGEPIEGVAVYAMRSMYFEGQRRMVPISGAVTTDDAGEYRLRRLAPGTYFVMAKTSETWTVVENGQETVFGYMPTYFPGVAAPGDGRRITLGLGQEASATDFLLVPGRTATVSGQALDSRGRPFSRVNMSVEVRGLNFASFSAGAPLTVSADGSFVAKNVAPGEYTLSATRLGDSSEFEREVAVATITVAGADVENVMLVGSSGGTVSGRVVVEGSNPPKFSTIHVAVAEPFRHQGSGARGALSRREGPSVREDGTFSIPHVLGRARFRVNVPEGWILKAVMHEGRDITDAPLELASNQELSGVQVIITDRVTSVTGQVTDENNVPMYDATVLVFPSDPERWYENAHSVRAARPDQEGRWQVKGLRPGEYLTVALDYVEDGAWHDPEFLESLRRYATAVRLPEGGAESVALKLADEKP